MIKFELVLTAMVSILLSVGIMFLLNNYNTSNQNSVAVPAISTSDVVADSGNVENISPEEEPALVWTKDNSGFRGETPSTPEGFFLTTALGTIPTVLFCKDKENKWGITSLYLDLITDEFIRYRRTAGSRDRTIRHDSMFFTKEGKFYKREGNLPETNCEQKNILN